MEAVAEKQKRSSSTPALRLIVERVGKMIQEDEPDRYPNGAAFIATDLPGLEKTLKGCIAARNVFVLVFPDGGEVIAMPARNRAVAMLRRLLARLDRRDKNIVPPGLASVQLPADYVVEVREPVSSA